MLNLGLNMYLCAAYGGDRDAVCDRNYVDTWETFKITSLGTNTISM